MCVYSLTDKIDISSLFLYCVAYRHPSGSLVILDYVLFFLVVVAPALELRCLWIVALYFSSSDCQIQLSSLLISFNIVIFMLRELAQTLLDSQDTLSERLNGALLLRGRWHSSCRTPSEAQSRDRPAPINLIWTLMPIKGLISSVHRIEVKRLTELLKGAVELFGIWSLTKTLRGRDDHLRWSERDKEYRIWDEMSQLLSQKTDSRDILVVNDKHLAHGTHSLGERSWTWQLGEVSNIFLEYLYNLERELS